MTEVKPGKSPAVVEPIVRYTPAEVARNKKARDGRRKSIRDQNARSRMK
jgi:hypothetical protein